MNKTFNHIMSFIGLILGLYVLGISKQFNGYLINSIWWQTPNSFFIGLIGLITIIISLMLFIKTAYQNDANSGGDK